ncbi:MAG: hypothetical protein V4459_03135 [Pseudomonadota bacterium]
MKRLLIAAGMMAAMFGAAPSMAAPVSPAAAVAAPQPGQEMRSDRDRRVTTTTTRTTQTDRRPGWNNRTDNRRYVRNQRRWSSKVRCTNVRRHHRWVRVCTRR